MTSSKLIELCLLSTSLVAWSLAASPARAQSANPPVDFVVEATRLDRARNQISTSIGASTYEINRQAIQAMPQGDNSEFNQVLLQAPGVAQDSFGQLHVRGEHANLQYRINGVTLPEGITGFGQVLDSRIVRGLNFITGALPAQYGYRTAGIVEIETKSGTLEPGGSVGLYGGTYRTVNPSFEYGKSAGSWDLYVTANFLRDNIGIENPTSSPRPIHDRTDQEKAFAYLSGLVGDGTRLSFIVGSSVGRFQIPNNPGQTPGFTAFGVSDFDSSKLNEQQLEHNHFAVAAIQQSVGDVNYQVAAFTRYSSVHFFPDVLGDVVFNGIAANVRRESVSSGVQGDVSYRLNDAHTLRAGVFFSGERTRSATTSTVLPLDDAGNPVDAPFNIVDQNHKLGVLAGTYLQDEWRLAERFTINAGLRFDYMNQYIAANQLSPRVNAVYRMTDDTTIRAGFARTFTPPPQELLATTTLTSFVNTSAAPNSLMNDPVKPERANYYDVGILQRLAPGLQVGVNAYYKDVRDLLDEGQFGTALIFTPFNYQKGRIYGVEFTANYQLGNWQAYGNLAWARAQGKNIESGQFNFAPDQLDFISKNWVFLDHDQRLTASAGLSYLWDDTRFSIAMLYGTGLRRGFANTDHLPPYITFNLGVSREMNLNEFGKYTARFDVVNLFDKVYELRDGTGIGVGAPQFGQRRGFYFGISRQL